MFFCALRFFTIRKNESKKLLSFVLPVAFGESSISGRQVQLYYNWFKEGREDDNDNARLGRPNTSTTI